MQHGYNLRDALRDLLSDEMCRKVIDYYFKRVFLGGRYYTLKEAKEMVAAHNFRSSKEESLKQSNYLPP
jgi:hypothetical protein